MTLGEKKQKLIVIAGPTAVGKSELAAETARRIDGEVISADSMQVYKYMDIGSAKITKEEMLGVPHHLIDVHDPKDPMDVAEYQRLAKAAIAEISGRGHIPILCGGTGFYIQAVVRDIDFTETEADPAYRKELADYADRHGNEALHELLQKADPEAAAEIHPNNRKRVIRALEYKRETGRTISEHNREERLRPSPYDLLYIVLTDDRETLYRRIDRRVDFMMDEGLYEEVQFLLAMGLRRSDVSMQGLGYKELIDAVEGRISRDEAVRVIKRDSRHYAKRQITWFKREGPDVIWIRRSDFGEDSAKILSHVLGLVRERFGIIPHRVRDPYT